MLSSFYFGTSSVRLTIRWFGSLDDLSDPLKDLVPSMQYDDLDAHTSCTLMPVLLDGAALTKFNLQLDQIDLCSREEDEPVWVACLGGCQFDGHPTQPLDAVCEQTLQSILTDVLWGNRGHAPRITVPQMRHVVFHQTQSRTYWDRNLMSDTIQVQIEPTEEQAQALDAISDWVDSRYSNTFVLAGLAGTGKTSLLPLLPDVLGGPVRYVCPTWKAASNLTKRLDGAVATSIHDLIYDYNGIRHDEDCEFWNGNECDMNCKDLHFLFREKENVRGLIVVDEASMVDQYTRRDLESLGRPVLYVGDHGQLPPVRGTSIFSERPPDVRLKKIQRQAKGSPIIQLSRVIRKKDIHWHQAARDLGFQFADPYDLASGGHDIGAAVFVAYRNREVDAINKKVRRWLGRREILEVGDQVIVRDNMKRFGVFNGQAAIVEAVGNDGSWARLRVESGRLYAGRVAVADSALSGDREEEVCRINYGYALTCHRAQGSEYAKVVIKLPAQRDWNWLYTAVTRARSEVVFR